MICRHFYFYHNEIICQCTQQESNCLGIIEKCNNKLAKKSYEADIKEERNKNVYKLN